VDYFSLFLDNPYPMSLLLLLLLAFFRLVPIVIIAPFFGANLLPGPVKVGLVLSLAVIFLPHLMQITTMPIAFDLNYIGLVFKEMVIGFMLGFLVAIPFWMATSSGILIDNQRGSSSMMINDPTLRIQASPIGQLYNFVLIYMFFLIGGVFFFLDSVTLSFTVIPPTEYFSAAFFLDSNLPIWQKLMDSANIVMTIGVQLAAPALVAILMSDLFLGISNRMAPQVPMAFLGWALKSLVGLSILWVSWFFILKQLEHQSIRWLVDLHSSVESFAAGKAT
jgi:type III secretion protein T